MMTLPAVTFLVVFLAFSNGANDVSKGVATLLGGGVSHIRRVLLWGMAGNVAGGLAALHFGGALVQTFGGGFLIPGFVESGGFMISVLLGASLWVFLSTLKGWPVSTTHALIGGILGAAVVSIGTGGFVWRSLWDKAVIPLLASPLVAMGLAFFFWKGRKWIQKNDGLFAFKTGLLSGPTFLHRLHWISAGATSFARGLNDVPKMAALLVVAGAGATAGPGAGRAFALSIALVSLAMGIGGIWKGLRILRVLSFRVTPLDPSTGLIANLSTTLPTLLASPLGLPVSTTHVSAGALFGIRILSRKSPHEEDALRSILGAWLVTFPAAAILAALLATTFKLLKLT